MNRLWFAGSGKFGARCLELLSREFSIQMVITSPPARAGRKYKKRPTPVEDLAGNIKSSIYRTASFSDDEYLLERLSEETPEAIIVVDFGQMISEPFLSFSKAGCLNIHPSLLPLYRGASPIQRAILDGRVETGVSVFRLDTGMDSGPVVKQASKQIAHTDTCGDLMESLAFEGSRIMTEVIRNYRKGIFPLSVQDDGKASYAPKIQRSEAHFSWDENALAIHNRVRAFNPVPGAFTEYKGRRLKIWKTGIRNIEGKAGKVIELVDGYPVIAAGSGALLLETVQPEGKKPVSGKDWINGSHIRKDDLINE